MFEKDIYALIRGLRAHRGSERAYINQSLSDCRKEIRSTDLDAKATALLKLIYLEMFGHDMSWASFNVLEVMSSPKYLQKRVGYLAAVQSFRPETEVLVLAENLLKKDLGNVDKGVIGLVLGTVPHVVSPAMANSLLADLLPRMGHSSPAVRKKTIVTLYRLALVYPETLRPAWPKMREKLLDEDEDPSVTAAIVNVVCELGWRRPHDFLPLAPRLFELLTAGGNNWMAIKIIKLFSALTPLEPRLVKKLLPPLTSIIKTTPAMSLLYECINGIIQGGIMEAAEGTTEGDEVARLCVHKLSAMLVVEGDPNLRYVALLAFAKITASHADLVAEHQTVILECIDDGDISIRARALDLVVGMIHANNLQTVVERLLTQLRSSGAAADPPPQNRTSVDGGILPMADEDDEEMQTSINPREPKSSRSPPLPDDYRTSVIERILHMCSRESYSYMQDFEWYVGVLVELVRQCPSHDNNPPATENGKTNVAEAIGAELLNVAVRVRGVRAEAAAAAQSLLLLPQQATGVLTAACFIAGEYADLLPDANAVLTALTDSTKTALLPAGVLAGYIQALPKLFVSLIKNSARLSTAALVSARIVHFLEPLALHPELDVQERATEYLELMRLVSEACSSHQQERHGEGELPLLLTQALPALFSGGELNPVAPSSLRKVPLSDGLDLEEPVNGDLDMLLKQAEYDFEHEEEDADGDEVYQFYHEKPSAAAPTALTSAAAADLLERASFGKRAPSYQGAAQESSPLDPEARERKRAERRERYRDDPYYIDSERASGTSTPVHSILRAANGGEELDVDAIPVMELKLDDVRDGLPELERVPREKKKARKRFEVLGDETVGDGSDEVLSSSLPKTVPKARAGKKGVLGLDSSGIASLSLTSSGNSGAGERLEVEQKHAEEEEMAKAMKEVERLRLEMQRRMETVQEPDEEGMVVKRKVKKKKTTASVEEAGEADERDEGDAVVKKKKKKKRREEGADGKAEEEGGKVEGPVASKAKRKKKRQVTFDEGGLGS